MMMYYIITEGLVDATFIESRTEGFEAFQNELLNIDFDALEEGCNWCE